VVPRYKSWLALHRPRKPMQNGFVESFNGSFKAEWHGPLGKDTSRTIGAKDAEMLEQFFEWEEGRKFGFRLDRGTVGILKAMAEHYELIPKSDTTSEVLITYRIETKGLAKPLGPILMSLFKLAGKNSMKKLSAYLIENTIV